MLVYFPLFLFIKQPYWINSQEHPEQSINELLPSNCGQRAKDFDDDADLIFQKVVHGSIAPKGTYPWQVDYFYKENVKFFFTILNEELLSSLIFNVINKLK